MSAMPSHTPQTRHNGLASLAAAEVVVVAAILLVLTSVLSFGIYSIYEDSKRQFSTVEVGKSGEQLVVNSVTHAGKPTRTAHAKDILYPEL